MGINPLMQFIVVGIQYVALLAAIYALIAFAIGVYKRPHFTLSRLRYFALRLRLVPHRDARSVIVDDKLWVFVVSSFLRKGFRPTIQREDFDTPLEAVEALALFIDPARMGTHFVNIRMERPGVVFGWERVDIMSLVPQGRVNPFYTADVDLPELALSERRTIGSFLLKLVSDSGLIASRGEDGVIQITASAADLNPFYTTPKVSKNGSSSARPVNVPKNFVRSTHGGWVDPTYMHLVAPPAHDPNDIW